MPRYKLTGLPPEGALGVSAFFPHLNRMAASGAMRYKYLRPGSGPAAYHPIFNMTATAPQHSNLAIATMGWARSSDAPDAIWNNDYDAIPDPNYRPGLLIQMYDPTRPQDTTMIPVPAVSLRQRWLRDSATLAMGVVSGGASTGQIRQPVSQIVEWWSRLRGNGLPRG